MRRTQGALLEIPSTLSTGNNCTHHMPHMGLTGALYHIKKNIQVHPCVLYHSLYLLTLLWDSVPNLKKIRASTFSCTALHAVHTLHWDSVPNKKNNYQTNSITHTIFAAKILGSCKLYKKIKNSY